MQKPSSPKKQCWKRFLTLVSSHQFDEKNYYIDFEVVFMTKISILNHCFHGKKIQDPFEKYILNEIKT